MSLFTTLLAAGTDPEFHHECFRCGRNCTADDVRCPNCGGPVRTYRVD